MASICNKQHSHNFTTNEYCTNSCLCNTFDGKKSKELKELFDINIEEKWIKNIKYLKKIINQTEKYLVMIYELLIACYDQITKISTSTSITDCDFLIASMYVKQYINEIRLIVGGAQCNGISLLQDTVSVERGFKDVNFAADGEEGIAAYISNSKLVIKKTNVNVNNLEITVDNVTGIEVGSYVIKDNGTSYAIIESIDSNNNKFILASNIEINNDDDIYITPPILTDKLIYDEIIERDNITIKNIGPGCISKNNNCRFNIFIFDLPKVGIHSLGLTSFTSASGFDYYINGLENITDNINTDTFISDFNNAIKIIGVEINKMTAYRNICSLKEKQIKIHKDAKKMH